jgi:hypothetical protein
VKDLISAHPRACSAQHIPLCLQTGIPDVVLSARLDRVMGSQTMVGVRNVPSRRMIAMHARWTNRSASQEASDTADFQDPDFADMVFALWMQMKQGA